MVTIQLENLRKNPAENCPISDGHPSSRGIIADQVATLPIDRFSIAQSDERGRNNETDKFV